MAIKFQGTIITFSQNLEFEKKTNKLVLYIILYHIAYVKKKQKQKKTKTKKYKKN